MLGVLVWSWGCGAPSTGLPPERSAEPSLAPTQPEPEPEVSVARADQGESAADQGSDSAVAAVVVPAAASEPTSSSGSAESAELSWDWLASDDSLVVVKGGRVATERVYFQLGRAILHDRSFRVMDRLAAFLIAHPDITLLRIEGHTDNRGRRDFNLRLSAARAHAIASELVARGIACERLQPVGYGETRPISGNKTTVGRSRNRRMEFRIARYGATQRLPPVGSGAQLMDPC